MKVNMPLPKDRSVKISDIKKGDLFDYTHDRTNLWIKGSGYSIRFHDGLAVENSTLIHECRRRDGRVEMED